MSFIKYIFNYYYEKLHRYVFDYCFQSQNEDWGEYTPYKKANRNNQYESYNGMIIKVYEFIRPFFKGWRKQLLEFKPKEIKYQRYK